MARDGVLDPVPNHKWWGCYPGSAQQPMPQQPPVTSRVSIASESSHVTVVSSMPVTSFRTFGVKSRQVCTRPVRHATGRHRRAMCPVTYASLIGTRGPVHREIPAGPPTELPVRPADVEIGREGTIT